LRHLFSAFAANDKVPLRGVDFLLRQMCIQIPGAFFLAFLAIASAVSQQQRPQPSAPQTPSTTKSSTPVATPVGVITAINVVEDHGAPALEILSTLPSVPSIQFLESPPRIVVDLLHARIGLKDKLAPVQLANIVGVRAEQYQADPPITRVVLDLAAPYGYTWDEDGNRLMVRLKPPEDLNAHKKARSKPPAEFSLLAHGAPAIIPVTRNPGEVKVDGSRIAAGSSLTAGAETAALQLSRGGEVRVCPGTTVSITPSKNAKDLMLGISSGALETHYQLDSSSDTILTPDFRILLAGPGAFDFAISSDPHGNTCVRGLAGNASSAIVSELMGTRTYQVKPTEQVVFRAGQIDRVDSNVPLECGCPPPVPVLLASTPSPAHETKAPSGATLTPEADPSKTATNPTPAGNTGSGQLSSGPEVQPLPPSKPGDVQVKVEAPIVFRAKQQAPAAQPPVDQAKTLPATETATPAPQIQATTQPVTVKPAPAPPQASAPKRMLRRIRGFFSAVFG
jgi:AMIN domain-containing protein